MNDQEETGTLLGVSLALLGVTVGHSVTEAFTLGRGAAVTGRTGLCSSHGPSVYGAWSSWLAPLLPSLGPGLPKGPSRLECWQLLNRQDIHMVLAAHMGF